MQYFIKLHICDGERWGHAIKHLKIANDQPHVLPNFKLHMLSCFIGMFFILFLILLQEIIGLGI
jgi:hypothetical protein